MKKILFAFLVAAPALLHAQFNAQKDPLISKSLASEKLSKMDITTSHGNIAVSKVAASEARVEVFVRPNNGNNREQSLSKEEIQQRLNDYYELEIAVHNGELTAYAKLKEKFSNAFNWKKSLSISFIVYTAEAMPSELKTSHGDIDITGMKGEQDLSTSHGNIRVTDIAGKVSGGTSHGNLTIKNVNDGVKLSTSHGNINAAHCDGNIRLTTSNGNVELKNLKGNIDAQTTHGNVGGESITGELSAVTSHGDISLGKLDASVKTSTSHGNISLELAKGKGMDLDLHGKKIQVDKLENFNGSKEEKSMKGTVNGGGQLVKAQTSQGNVSLRFL